MNKVVTSSFWAFWQVLCQCFSNYPIADYFTWYHNFSYLARKSKEISEFSPVRRDILLTVVLGLLVQRSFQIWFTRKLASHTPLGDPTPKDDDPFKLDTENWEHDLQSKLKNGLSTEDALSRRQRYGFNEFRETADWRHWTLWTVRNVFLDSDILFTITVSLTALVLRDYVDAALMSSFTGVNWFLHIKQIREAENVVRSMIGNPVGSAVTLRDGSFIEIPFRELVPGDVIHVKQGGIMWADSRVISPGPRITMDQSSITGDNRPIRKYQGDICYFGTGCLYGDALLIVNETGYNTFLGRTLELLDGDPFHRRPSPRHSSSMHNYNSAYYKFVASVGIVLCFLTLTVSATMWYFSDAVLSTERTYFVMMLAMIMLPVSMRSKISTLRATGLSLLTDSGAVLQRTNGDGMLHVEHLGAVDVLCSDKSGTLTQNKLIMVEPFCVSGDANDLILTACLASPSGNSLDRIDLAFMRALRQFPQAKAQLPAFTNLGFAEFDASTKIIQSLVQSPTGQRIICVKGAPRAVLGLCDPPEDIAEHYKEAAARFARLGYRSLGVARKVTDQNWELLGLAPLYDPPRTNLGSTLRAASAYNVKVKMLTGDARLICSSFAKEVGIGENTFLAEELDQDSAVHEARICAAVEAADSYNEVSPVHKFKIVSILQNYGHCVIMTGDGIEEVHCLTAANVGVALSGASEKAQSASDVVMLKDGLSEIVRAIQTSRQIFQQVSAYIVYRVLLSIHLLFAMVACKLVLNELLRFNTILFNMLASDLVAKSLTYGMKNGALRKRINRWSTYQLWSRVLPLALMLAVDTLFALSSIQSAPSAVRASSWSNFTFKTYDTIASNQDMSVSCANSMFLHLTLSSQWVIPLLRTNGRFYVHSQNWWLLGTLLTTSIVATLLCTCGWVDYDHQLSLQAAGQIWYRSLGSFCLVSGACALMWTTPINELTMPLLDDEGHGTRSQSEIDS